MDNGKPINKSQCNRCKYYLNSVPLTCPAFPKGIPKDILNGDRPHIKFMSNQQGDYIFKPIE